MQRKIRKPSGIFKKNQMTFMIFLSNTNDFFLINRSLRVFLLLSWRNLNLKYAKADQGYLLICFCFRLHLCKSNNNEQLQIIINSFEVPLNISDFIIFLSMLISWAVYRVTCLLILSNTNAKDATEFKLNCSEIKKKIRLSWSALKFQCILYLQNIAEYPNIYLLFNRGMFVIK